MEFRIGYKRRLHDSQIDISCQFYQMESFQPHYGPGIDLAFDRNEYQESSWGWKAVGA
jgi:hypothetical protein